MSGDAQFLCRALTYSFSDFVPCVNGGTGEVVDFSGQIHTLVKTTNEECREQEIRGLRAGVNATRTEAARARQEAQAASLNGPEINQPHH